MRRRQPRRNGLSAGKIILTVLCAALFFALIITIKNMDNASGDNTGFLLTPGQAANISQQPEEAAPTLTSPPQPTPVPTPQPTPIIINANIHSKNVYLIRLSDGSVLYDKSCDEKIYPASLTKIMTCLIAVESLGDMSMQVSISSETITALKEERASMAGFAAEEQVTVKDIIYGAMLPSGGECCAAIAQAVCGSEEAFIEIMNKKAELLGMRNTSFANTTGLHDAEHYSTARDIAVLLDYALKNNMFFDIFTAQSYTSSKTSQHPDGIEMHSTLFKHLDSPYINDGEILGGKTGYTRKAGQCLASMAVKKNERFILITCGADGEQDIDYFHIDDAFTIYNSI